MEAKGRALDRIASLFEADQERKEEAERRARAGRVPKSLVVQ
jgi:hypothetical protein